MLGLQMRPADRPWIVWAMQKIKADFCRSSDTHLLPVRLPAFPGIQLYLKDESTHVTGSLKHRLARSLFLYALTNGRLKEGTLVVEASSGSTAISEAYFARLLRLPFVAVVPASTSKEKLALIEAQGGRCHVVDDPSTVYAVAAQLAAEADGHYMDQFTLRRARDGLAREQQHRRDDLRADARGDASDPDVDRGRRGNRRHRVDRRPLHSLPRT